MMIPPESIGPILQGVAALIVGSISIYTAIVIPIIKRWRREDKEEMKDHFEQKVWAIVEQRMIAAADLAGPDSTHVIRIMFMNGLSCAVPLTRGWVEVDPCGAKIQLLETSETETVYQLYCHAPYQISTHTHIEEESVKVERGSMTDLSTGDTYGENDVWTIPPKTPHAVFFSAGTLAIITVRPPLPKHTEVPLDLKHLNQIDSRN
jgi:hypothetical protein